MSKLAPIEKPAHIGCGTCPPQRTRLNMHGYYHPGFGVLRVTRDGEDVIHDIHGNIERPAMRAENAARKDPDHDWRLVVEGPMRGAVYQRHGRNEWKLVQQLDGFA